MYSKINIIITLLALFLMSILSAQNNKDSLNVDGDDFGEIEKINFFTNSIPLEVIGTTERYVTYEIISVKKGKGKVSDYFSITKKYNLLSFTEKSGSATGIKLKVTMPENLVLEFTNEASELSLSGLNTRYLEIDSERGVIGLANIVSDGIDILCNSCELNMESIDATISSVNKFGNTRIDVKELKLYNNFEHPIIATSDTGNITLNLPKDITTTIKIRAKSIHVDDALSPELKEEGKYTYVRILGDREYDKNKFHPNRNILIMSSNQGQVNIIK